MSDIEPHKDWYADGIEDGENLWRLDPLPDIQIQLFAEATVDETTDSEFYTGNFRLFIERDERDQTKEHRTFYAGEGFDITRERALELLKLGNEDAVKFLSTEISKLMTLSDDPRYHF